MKKYLILLAFLAGFMASAQAQVTITLDAGRLTGPSGVTTGGAAMQADNSSPPFSNGSLLLLVDLGSSNTLSNTITAGNFTAGTNFVLSAAGFNTGAGTSETLNSFTFSGGTTGDDIALLWFPQITYAQYLSGTLTSTGQYYGSYIPTTTTNTGSMGGTPLDGGSPWVVPTSGSNIDLYFNTSNSSVVGNETPSAGYANYVVATPEPSTFALLGLGLIVLLGARRMTSRRPAVCRVQR